MTTSDSYRQRVSGVSTTDEERDADEAGPTCPERACDGRLVAAAHETYCARCGVVVEDVDLDTGPTSAGRKQTDGGTTRWARESTTPFRVDGGLRTRIGRNTDARGNWLTDAQETRLDRLRTQHRRLRDRNDRLTEALRDVNGIGANLRLPRHVRADAAQLVRAAKRHRLPGGRLAWEALAGGAVLLAARDRLDGERMPMPADVATYTKAPLERTCAAARKLRVGLGRLDLPPVRDRAVDAVLAETGTAFGAQALLDVATLGRALLGLADNERIGPGTSRVTMAASAVDRATLLLDERPLSRADIVAAVSGVVQTSDSRLSRYSVDLEDALDAAHPRAVERPLRWAQTHDRDPTPGR